MGVKGYRVARELIENAFTTGFNTNGILEVLEGVPTGSVLVGIDFDFRNPHVTFWFEIGDHVDGDSYPRDDGYVVLRTSRPPVW